MPTINQLPSASTLSSSDQLPVYSSSNGDARKASLSALLTWLRSTFTSPGLDIQTAAPTSSGFTVTIADSTDDQIWLILNPTGSFAAGTIVLPASPVDGQTLQVTSSAAIATVMLSSGASIYGAPTSLGVGGFFELRYYALEGAWYTTSQSLGATGSFNDVTITGDILDASGDTMLAFLEGGDVPSPGLANHLTVIYAENGGEVGFAAQGDSTNIAIALIPKGTGAVTVSGSVAASAEVSGNSGAFDDLACLNLDVDTVVRQTVVTVAALGSAATPGHRKFVSDANATTFASIVAGGGANNVPVYSDGTNWRIG